MGDLSTAKAAVEALPAAAFDKRVELSSVACVYRQAAGRLDVPADAMCLVDVHASDIHARCAGWKAACSRTASLTDSRPFGGRAPARCALTAARVANRWWLCA